MEPDPDEQLHPGEEDLAWFDDSVKGKKPKGLYSNASEKARGLISTERQCSMFCGGKKCKYCSGEGWEPDEYAIKGLYSHWVTDKILAMARPSNYGIQNHRLVDQFKEQGIKSIINLQIAGEHGDCGPHKLDPSGFLYNPQAFMEQGVFFYNFGWGYFRFSWPDYGVASLSTILDMVKVMQFALTEGKVAIHCHAGRGRTGVIIACYLVFTNRISGTEAIHYVRDKRPQSIQTRQQMQVIQEFEQYLQPFRIVFPHRHGGSHEFTLQQFLNRQRHVLHGYEARRLKFVPKIIYTVCERLLELAKKGSSLQRQLEKRQKDSPTFPHVSKTFSNLSQNSNGLPAPIQQSASKDSIATVTSKRKKAGLKFSLKNRMKSISMEDLADDKFKSVINSASDAKIENNSISSSNSSGAINDNDDDDDNSIVFGNSVTDLRMGQYSCRASDTTSQSGTVDMSINHSIMTADMAEDCVQAVAYALSADKIEPYEVERAKQHEDALNTSDSAWLTLATEGDTHVLSLLLWDWLDQLKEPVLRAQDLQVILQHVEDPTVALQKLEKGTRNTIEYLLKVISRLRPMKEETLVNIHEKLLSHLCHQWVVCHGMDSTDSWAGSTRSLTENIKEHWDDMRPERSEQLFIFFHRLQMDLHDRQRAKFESY
ncbi:protein tyrosine phosphatase domain-containing protein 1-like isoform X3 [Dreissena polymorpha]|uniref:protein tyrosine phosphatase domain-containing protein 1-like isoform X3 n=1 Tax=Dreissena polymorpha TaxID=45954 RepID=UPI00226485F1|nr:protein tyrosine phosphatase domain-containing protein 1-like isoform X3 [Dreissena polymorpha]